MNSSNYVANKYSVYPVSAPLHPCEICFNDIEANRVAHHAINSTPTDTNWHSLHVECLQGWVDIRGNPERKTISCPTCREIILCDDIPEIVFKGVPQPPSSHIFVTPFFAEQGMEELRRIVTLQEQTLLGSGQNPTQIRANIDRLQEELRQHLYQLLDEENGQDILHSYLGIYNILNVTNVEAIEGPPPFNVYDPASLQALLSQTKQQVYSQWLKLVLLGQNPIQLLSNLSQFEQNVRDNHYYFPTATSHDATYNLFDGVSAILEENKEAEFPSYRNWLVPVIAAAAFGMWFFMNKNQ